MGSPVGLFQEPADVHSTSTDYHIELRKENLLRCLVFQFRSSTNWYTPATDWYQPMQWQATHVDLVLTLSLRHRIRSLCLHMDSKSPLTRWLLNGGLKPEWWTSMRIGSGK